MFKKMIVTVFVLLLVLLPAVSAGPDEVKVNIMVLPGTTGLSLVKMIEENPDLGASVTASYTVVKSPDQMVAKIISGEGDIAALPTNLASVLYNKGVPVKLGAVTNWGVMYLVGRDTTIRDWTDLKGKNISNVGKGASPDILLRYLLSANGVNPENDVTIEYYKSPVELAQLTIAGKTDMAVLPEPWVTEVINKNSSCKILLDFQKEWKRTENQEESYPLSCIVVRNRLAENHPDVVANFMKQAAASSDWVNKEPAEAALLAEKHILISKEAATDAIPRCNLRFVEASDAKGSVDNYLRKLHSFNPKTIGGKVPDDKFYLPAQDHR